MQQERVLRTRKVARNRCSVQFTDWEKQIQLLDNWNNELCSGESLPEVEIISLLEEQIPKYKLRADTITQFGGYENQDWFITSPALQVDATDLKLSPDQIRETLNYFLLCSDRVSQMTKTYDDIEAVTRLLEEKEKDLELTARIGKELLQTNNKLENTVACLECDLKAAMEKITQLSHEVQKKSELIQILTNDVDETLLDTDNSGCINLEVMQKKMASLEEENNSLKKEYLRLETQTELVENQEQLLLKDLTGQLTDVNTSISYMEEELDRQKEENRQQHEQILILQAKLQDTELKLATFAGDNDELSSLLAITKENQGCLAVELSEFKARYYEMEKLLHDAQEQLRKYHKKQMPGARINMFSSMMSNNSSYYGTGPPSGVFDNLQNELEMSLHSEFSSDSGIASGMDLFCQPHYKRVFDTVRCASQCSSSSNTALGLTSQRSNSASNGSINLCQDVYNSSSTASGPKMSSQLQPSLELGKRRMSNSLYSSGSTGYPSVDSAVHSDSDFSHADSSDECYPGPPQKGVPGVPGAADLAEALKRLTPSDVLLRRSNLQNAANSSLWHEPPSTYGLPYSEPYLNCRTPDSLMSSRCGVPYRGWRVPDKLQIVKPLEGSHTLQQWSQLAKPTFGGLLDERPGVKIRGGKELDEMGLETYGLCDLEEDEEVIVQSNTATANKNTKTSHSLYNTHPGKMFECGATTFTYINSTVMHPDDSASDSGMPPTMLVGGSGTMSTYVNSTMTSRVSSVCSSRHTSPPPTPRPLSRRNSCSTFSTTFGIAKMLNERGIQAATPSAFNTPCGPNSFTPTATPCNSPDALTPLSTRAPSPEIFTNLPQKLLGTVPSMLRDNMLGPVTGPMRKKLVQRKKTEKGLVGKIEQIGISNLMGGGGSVGGLPVGGSGLYARPLASPMRQLTCLLPVCHEVPENISNKASPSLPSTSTPTASSGKTAQRKKKREGITRPDLGVVPLHIPKPAPTMSSENKYGIEQPATLGTLSSLLFGRKGGLF